MRRGFTLVELLIYTVIFAAIAITLAYVLTVFLRINTFQIASAEVSNQANFILQKIQQEISRASFLVVNDGEFSDTEDDEKDSDLGTGRSRLVIKPKEDVNVVIYRSGSDALMKVGGNDPVQLNNGKVLVDDLTFTKISNPPGRDLVQINLILRYNTPNPQAQLTRQFLLGVGKASAATFDTNLVPAANDAIAIGTTVAKWTDLFLSRDLEVGGRARLGSGSDQIGYLRQGTVSINPPDNIASGAVALAEGTLTGALSGDRIFVTPPYNLEAGLVFVGAETSADKVKVKILNAAGASSGTTASRSWYYLLIRN